MPSHLPDTDTALASDLVACRALLRGGSRTFFAASHVLPRRVAEPATALYAFCRLADDAVDLHGGKLGALAHLRERLERAYDGHPLPAPADRGFAEVVARFAIPRALPEALLEGLAWDAVGRRYEDVSALTDYAVRVAGSVGAMMAIVMGERSAEVVARACDLGVAMQLTNIARDVGEDARAGRLYLPLLWLREAGINPDAWLARPVFCPALGPCVQRLLNLADVLYQRSSVGISRLPRACRPGIRAARLLYAEIGREVERHGCDSVSRRAIVPSTRKVSLLMQAVTAIVASESAEIAPPLEEAQFLIDAIADAPARRGHFQIRQAARGRFEDRFVWLIDLFERLERRQQFGRTP
jgi:15-cis-phytoene synthase